jgi:hypothetical protein
MKTLKFAKFFILILIFGMSISITAQNKTISIQSTLKNISGEAVPDGIQSIIFKLYNVEEAGTAVWTETANVEVVSGIYSHELGSVTALVASHFGVQLYLGVTINNKELAPRTKLGYAPYAMTVTALAASGQSASFNSSGKFVVSDAMSVSGLLETTGITNTGTINSTGTIKSSDKIGIGLGTNTPSIALAVGDSDTGIRQHADGDMRIVTDNIDRIAVKPSGRVGIGTNDPQATLHVKGSNMPTATPESFDINIGPATLTYTLFARGFRNSILGEWASAATAPNVCAYFEESVVVDNSIYVGEVASWSDRRIKTNLQKSNGAKDLALLNKIEITEYDHIDKINKDSRRQKRVIAQQVKDVLPNATQMSKMVIPNVYEWAKHIDYENGILTVQTAKAHEFAVGDEIDLKTPKQDLNNLKVLKVIDGHTFAVKTEEKPGNVFVYGKYVNDFLSVDYDDIAMLNVSATQEMYRMIIDLQKANKNLIEENNQLKSSTSSIEDRLAILESLMVKTESRINHNTDKTGN